MCGEPMLPEATVPLVEITPERRGARRPPWLLVAAAAIVATSWILVHLALAVRGGGVLGFDRTLMLTMRVPGHPAVPAGPAWLGATMRDITALGGGPVLTIVVTLVCAFLILKRQWRPAVLVVVAVVSGSLAIATAKWFFARARPDLIDHLVVVTSKSFPSGHAGNSAIVYLTVACLTYPVIRETRLRAFVMTAALLLVGAIGVSRVYLGVHWPSDVLAGWLFGALWALGWWGITARWLPRSPARECL